MADFAIYRASDGELISTETDAATQRLSDAQLTSRGLARKPIAGPITAAFQWNLTTRDREPLATRAVPADETARLALVAKTYSTDTEKMLQLLLKKVQF